MGMNDSVEKLVKETPAEFHKHLQLCFQLEDLGVPLNDFTPEHMKRCAKALIELAAMPNFAEFEPYLKKLNKIYDREMD